MPCEQNAGQGDSINIGNKLFQNMAKLKYLRVTLTCENYMQEKVNS